MEDHHPAFLLFLNILVIGEERHAEYLNALAGLSRDDEGRKNPAEFRGLWRKRFSVLIGTNTRVILNKPRDYHLRVVVVMLYSRMTRTFKMPFTSCSKLAFFYVCVVVLF